MMKKKKKTHANIALAGVCYLTLIRVWKQKFTFNLCALCHFSAVFCSLDGWLAGYLARRMHMRRDTPTNKNDIHRMTYVFFTLRCSCCGVHYFFVLLLTAKYSPSAHKSVSTIFASEPKIEYSFQAIDLGDDRGGGGDSIEATKPNLRKCL